MKIIGITGGIGSGKTTVSTIFEIIGVPVYIADIESKKLTDSSTEIKEKLCIRFGMGLYPAGKLDKKMLANLIFNKKENLDFVNSVIHPAVHKDFQQWVSQQNSRELLAIESAILFESGFDKTVDVIVNITAPVDLRVKRVQQRDSTSKESILSRINNQLPEEERNKRSDYIIYNNETQALIPQVENLIKRLSY